MPPRADTLDAAIPVAIAEATERAMLKRPSARYASAKAFAEALAEARASSPASTGAPISVPPARSSEPPPVTREMAIVSTGLAPTDSIPPTIDHTPRPPAWRRWVLALVLLALAVGIVLGALLVVGVIEFESSGIDVDEAVTPVPPPPPAPLQPMASEIPSATPPVPVDACARLRGCCDAFRARVRPGFTDCDHFMAGVLAEPDACLERMVIFQEMAGQEGNREVPTECIAP